MALCTAICPGVLALAALAFWTAMCLLHNTFPGFSENKFFGLFLSCSLHNVPSNLTPSLKKENQLFSAIFGGRFFLATGTVGSAVLTSYCWPSTYWRPPRLLELRLAEVTVLENSLFRFVWELLGWLELLLPLNFLKLHTDASRSRAKNRQLPARKAIRAAEEENQTNKHSRRMEAGLTIEKC